MIRDLVYYGDQRLRKKTEFVTAFDDSLKSLVQDLMDTVDAKLGAGLAAPQIGVLQAIFVCLYDNGSDANNDPILCDPKVYINPILSNPSTHLLACNEGCLSIPGIQGKVLRPDAIQVEACNIHGEKFVETVTGWRARVVMHENDHLNGTLFIDRLGKKEKSRVLKTLNARLNQ